MTVHRRWTFAVIGVLCALLLPACVGSTSEQAAGTAQGERTVWGPVSLILPKGFSLIKNPSALGTAENYSATNDPETYRSLLTVNISDTGEIKTAFNARTQAKIVAETARIIATGGAVSLKQTRLAGTDDAWTMEYDAAHPVDPGQQTHHHGIFADVGDQFILIIGQAPTEGFQGGAVATALASVRIEG